MSEREEKFEKMLRDIQHNYTEVVEKMEKLKADKKTKSATYRQLMGNKLTYQNMLFLYKIYGLVEEQSKVKTIDIVGKNYFGKWNKTRAACRGIIIRENEILLSYEAVTDEWMIPGGGVEDGESEKECCIREVAEETGVLIKVSECLLEIDEYYEDWKWVNKYFIGEVAGTTEMKLTEREKEAGMEPRWLPVEEAKSIFAKHNMYSDKDEMRRGMYLREYTALCELLK